MTKIMIVEDDGLISLELRKKIESWGYQVVAVAESAQEAVKTALVLKPDVILMDIILRGHGDGIEAVESLKKHLDIPIIYTTAYSDETTMRRARETNPEAYLIKPFNNFELHAAIEMALQRQKYMQKIKESERRYRGLFNNSMHGIIIQKVIANEKGKVEDFQILDVNPIFEEQTAMPLSQHRGKLISQVTDEAYEHPFFDIFTQVFLENRSIRFEHYADDVNRFFDVMVFPMGSDEIAAIFADITRKKRFEEALEASEQRYRRLVENSRDVFYRLNIKESQYEYLSPAVEEVFGYSVEEHYDHPQLLQEIIDPQWRGYYDEQFQKLLNGMDELLFEYAVTNNQGKRVWVQQSNVVLRDAEGHPQIVEGVLRDVTVLKKIEEF